jgi:signal transduction histidine kinase
MDQHRYWSSTLPEGEFRKLLVEESYQPASEFWTLVDGQIVPAIKNSITAAESGNLEGAAAERAKALEVARGPLRASFLEHEQAIIRLAELAEQQRVNVEVNAADMVKQQSLITLAMFIAVTVMTGALGVIVARAIQRPISQLQIAASDAVQALSSADVDAGQIPDIAPVVVDSEDEAAAAASSFNSLLATTMELLRKQARMRRNNTEMFINLGRRNQNLVSRQLKFIDSLERSETDPELLASLFRLDHLATRMRRNAESLLVLAGLESPRKWRNPVPALEVARSAASEAEQFERIEFGGFDEIMIAGTAVANVVHLLAELLDNAVRYSPPDTVVTVSGVTVGNSLVITIADLGMGMSDQDLAAANARLASMQDLDEVPTAHLGLFVVARLATRHGIAVRLDSRGGEGLTALVALPPTILADMSGKPRTKAAPDEASMTPAPVAAGVTPAPDDRSGSGAAGGDGGRSIRPRRKKDAPAPSEPAPVGAQAPAMASFSNGPAELGSPAMAGPGAPSMSGMTGMTGMSMSPSAAPTMPAMTPPGPSATDAVALLPTAPMPETPAEPAPAKGSALGRFAPRRRKGADKSNDDASPEMTPAGPAMTGLSTAGPGMPMVDSVPFAPPLPGEPVPAPHAAAPPAGQMAVPFTSPAPAMPAGPTAADVDTPAFGPAAPALGPAGMFGAAAEVPTAAVAPVAEGWRAVEVPAPADTLALPSRAVRTPPAGPAGPTPQDAPPPAAAPGSALPGGGDASIGNRYADLPRAGRDPEPGTVADLPAAPAKGEGAAAPAAGLPMPTRPRTPATPARMPSSGLAGGSEMDSPFTGDGPMPSLPNRPVRPAASAGDPTPVTAPATAVSTPGPAPAAPAAPAAAAAPAGPAAAAAQAVPAAAAAQAAPAAPAAAAAPAAPAPPGLVVAPAAVPPPPPVPAELAKPHTASEPYPAAFPARPVAVPAPADAPALPGRPAAAPAAALGTPSRPSPPALNDPGPPLEPAAGADGDEVAGDGTTPSGLRKRVRQEPAVPFNRFAQNGDINVRKTRSPEAMKDRLMSFTAGKSAARSSEDQDAEPEYAARADEAAGVPPTNPSPQS